MLGLRKDQPTPSAVSRARAMGLASKIPGSWGLDGSLQVSKTEMVVPIWKNDAQHVVYGVVLEPDLVDSQGDIVDAEEIEKAAHRYLTDSRRSDIQHSEVQAGAIPVESYIAPHDMLLHGKLVKRGSWVMAHKITDPAVWGQIEKEELTGLSIGGSAVRVAEAA